ncbi:MAG: hypothetical protein V7736_16135 [Colwellia polaris]|jgi:hypothetical protein|uniref:hypothetical protein n=1 Tax=Colwellia polaris TaxID=326537 RepID=UPI000A1723FA|nr:hypothetical protein [Colwellia polaris]|tara:strand:+ start:27114 stop:27614 length:501 start_codon:yes stop_codon:yes gene_type:complete
MRVSFLLIPLLLSGCAGLPTYIEPPTNTPSAQLTVISNFDAPFLGYSTFINVHTEEDTCGKSFGSKSAAKLIVLDDSNPLISELNPDGVKLSVGNKYSFMIMSVAGMDNCTIYASFNPEINQYYKMNVSGVLGLSGNMCKAELYTYNEITDIAIPVDFTYYGHCKD